MANKKIIENNTTKNIDNFNESEELRKRTTFSRREVGLTHPDTSAFVRLNDRGEVEIFAGESLSRGTTPRRPTTWADGQAPLALAPREMQRQPLHGALARSQASL